MADIQLLLEAERRGILPPEKVSLLKEARARGLIEGKQEQRKPETTVKQDIGQGLGNVAAGAVRGAGSIGATLIRPFETAAENEARRQAMDIGLQEMGAQPESLAYQGGRIAGEVAGTAGAGGVLARGLGAVAQSPKVAQLAEALRTGGMSAGGAGMGTRIAGGAATGGTMAGMVSPQDAGTGAVIGGALPPTMRGAGEIGRAVGRTLSGQPVPLEAQQAIKSAREAGYVIPPTQARPSLVNRAIEGFAGKITTAQNASVRNQAITNEKVRKAIGAVELSPQGIADVRSVANKAYDALGSVGAFKADNNFIQALDRAGASTAELRKNFPELVNPEVDNLISGLKSRGKFEAQPTIEAIKRFRSDAAANKASRDPAKKALGRTQSNIANAFEDLIERNLNGAKGGKELLDNYRTARQTLAKTYEVEKALNPTTGNIDASKLAASLKKGKPLSGDLLSVAEFAARFPKATQTVEKMGSLPQLSPLDYGAAGIAGAVTASPLALAGLLARPAARSAALSPIMQNKLIQNQRRNVLSRLATSPEAEQLAYRTVPVIGAR